jgi:TseV toxin immunity protein TsiV
MTHVSARDIIMDFDKLNRKIKLRSGEYTFVSPGISICLFYAEPIQTLGPFIAEIFESYISFIPPNSLQAYLASDGAWKGISTRVINSILKRLRSIPPDYEFFEFHVTQGAPGNVGEHGVHFVGSHLADDDEPLETNILLLEFPIDLLNSVPVDNFIEFVIKVAKIREFDSGIAGCAFKHLLLTLRSEAFEAICQMAMRYLGFDISYDMARLSNKGQIYNLSWLTLLGPQIITRLGGKEAIRNALPPMMQVMDSNGGIIIRASELPIIGDVNRGALDIEPLSHLAQLTGKARMSSEEFLIGGPDFGEKWLTRFDPQ